MIGFRIFRKSSIDAEEEILYEGSIHTEPSKLVEYTNYKAAVIDLKNDRTLRSRVTKFPSKRLNALDLVFRALHEMIGFRNENKSSNHTSKPKGGRNRGKPRTRR